LRIGGLQELKHFPWSQRTGLARVQIQLKRAVANPADFLHVMSDLLEHFADLPVAPFVQRDFEPGVLSFLNHAYLCRRCLHAPSWIALLCN
jgi:hypothetical protein